METLLGVINKVIYFNAENGYTVASFLLDAKEAKNNILVYGKSITIVGNFGKRPIEDEKFEVTGEFTTTQKFGKQFKIQSYEKCIKQSPSALISYFTSDLFPGVGLKTAKTILEKLGPDAITKIKENPSIIDDFKFSQSITTTIKNELLRDDEEQKTILFLMNHGLTVDVSKKIYSALSSDVHLGKNYIELLSINPYIILDKVDRVGFVKCDQFAANIGIKPTDECRLKALICYVLKDQIYSTGNSYMLFDDLVSYMNKIDYSHEISVDKIESILSNLQKEQKIFRSANQVFDYRLYFNEIELASTIADIVRNNNCKHFEQDQIEACFNAIQEESKITYNPEQIDAIKSSMTNKMIVITGGPGTGKTTIIKSIIKMYELLNPNLALTDTAISLIAPTGRAAKRMTEQSGHAASTIHKFLGFTSDGSFEYNKFNKTQSRLIICDESSMMDLPLASRLFVSMNEEARIIVVGDCDQLPSVGPGQVLKDIIDSDIVKVVRLKTIMRQKEGSSIIDLAQSMNQGFLPKDILQKLPGRNFVSTDNEYLSKLVVQLYKKSLEHGFSTNDIQILIPMYNCPSGINEINSLIQNEINPETKDNTLKVGQLTYRINDRVIQLVNQPEKKIMNGDLGVITSFKYQEGKICGVRVLYDYIYADYEISDLQEITLAYAISIHKSQGSEFKVVILPVTYRYGIMLKRKLLYTAVTRAKDFLIAIGDVNALNDGIKKIEENRLTILKSKIIEFFNENNSVNPIKAKLAEINNLTVNKVEDNPTINSTKLIKNIINPKQSTSSETDVEIGEKLYDDGFN